MVAKRSEPFATCVPVPLLDHSQWWFFGFSVCEANAVRPDSVSKQPIPFSPQGGLLEHPTPGSSFSCWRSRVSAGPSHMRDTSAAPLLSFLCNRSLFSHSPHAPSAIPHSLPIHVLSFPSEQRLSAVFHLGFDLPFLYLCISQTDSIHNCPSRLRCQLVSRDFTGLDQIGAL